MKTIIVEKETIPDLRFPRKEVLKSDDELTQRIFDLQKGMIIGTEYKSNVRIIFEDNEGIKQVQSIIWSLTRKNVILKKGLFIPIHRIHKILT